MTAAAAAAASAAAVVVVVVVVSIMVVGRALVFIDSCVEWTVQEVRDGTLMPRQRRSCRDRLTEQGRCGYEEYTETDHFVI
ncbi:hypothetical protein E2C01_030866 [Portunus trituberculatus]|uniref:Uncharacterized protein n=1 Tax=Portunus trituberculatus TaxID=210409 RepID=A0A5B7ES62_PORTR|nr:hypothetical protein [Portunus trituberculatus]